MKHTLTYETSTHPLIGDCITYSNNEWAFVGKDHIGSTPRFSTAISHWAYYPKESMLVVLYKSSNDTYYHYLDVPFSTILAMMTAESLGSFIAKEIKPNFSVR